MAIVSGASRPLQQRDLCYINTAPTRLPDVFLGRLTWRCYSGTGILHELGTDACDMGFLACAASSVVAPQMLGYMLAGGEAQSIPTELWKPRWRTEGSPVSPIPDVTEWKMI